MWPPAEEWLPLLVPEMGTLTAHLCFALTSCHRHERTDESAAINLLCWSVRFYNSILLALCRGKRLYVCRIWYPILAWIRNQSTSDSWRYLCTDSFSFSVVWIVPILLSFPWNHDWMWRLITVLEMGFLPLHPWGLLPSTVKLTSDSKMSTYLIDTNLIIC